MLKKLTQYELVRIIVIGIVLTAIPILFSLCFPAGESKYKNSFLDKEAAEDYNINSEKLN